VGFGEASPERFARRRARSFTALNLESNLNKN
jgi:hypothetical protein